MPVIPLCLASRQSAIDVKMLRKGVGGAGIWGSPIKKNAGAEPTLPPTVATPKDRDGERSFRFGPGFRDGEMIGGCSAKGNPSAVSGVLKQSVRMNGFDAGGHRAVGLFVIVVSPPFLANRSEYSADERVEWRLRMRALPLAPTRNRTSMISHVREWRPSMAREEDLQTTAGCSMIAASHVQPLWVISTILRNPCGRGTPTGGRYTAAPEVLLDGCSSPWSGPSPSSLSRLWSCWQSRSSLPTGRSCHA